MKTKGFTLFEVLITCVIVGAVACIAIPQIMPYLSEFTLNKNTQTLEQSVKEARSTALKKSRLIYIDFSQAATNHDDSGGLIQIKQNDGTVISESYLDKNILFDSSSSTIANNKVTFDYMGQPVGDSNLPENFTESNNTITVKNNDSALSKSITISPITGATSIQ
ncbi:MAG: prepilin-type N-terminal cleavage/methylation domain-containing protein [Candidatus Gastranaerophilales bacterium]|nr:prepilin-type N-terminal cleavage/methylation domain-containing protein [Candidatus Gastranaerophilales bacterium]